MTQPVSLFETVPPTPTRTATVELFDPPLCCPTGICGPTLDQTLVDVNQMIFDLQSQGVSIARYQMTSNPNAFLRNEGVMRLVRERQMDALPITVVKGMVVKVGAYPTLEEVKIHLNGARS